jgi:methyltransferase-like protein/2-polyprenyl-3-methyl-5-hydroxy-6-metoxy-1,4-benzoquinol methylase
MADTSTTSYDEIPYGNHIFYNTHPDRLATVALLLGLAPAPVEACRVLEIGCGTGVNLAAMALTLPGSRFVGIDLSQRQIAEGQEIVQALGLTNVALQTLSLMEVDERFGQFDYIICHGVFSWVPGPVQEQILAICKRNLATAGVAYVSYNAYPGWHLRGMVREMLRFHVRQFTEPQQQVQQARAMLEFLRESAGERDSAYADILRGEAKLIEGTADAYLYHEHLEEENHPLYFHEFVARAAAHGLQYLAEAQPVALPTNLTPKVRQTLEELAVDVIHAEQYLDFVRNRMFRRTLLCHRDVTVRRPPLPQSVMSLLATAQVKPAAAPDLAPEAALEFRKASGGGLTTRDPLVKAALVELFDRWPQAVPFADLWSRTQQRLRDALPPEQVPALDDPLPLADALLQCYLSDLVELHLQAPCFTVQVSERPVASPLARLQAPQGAQVTCLRHRVVELGEFERQLLPLLDGSRDQAALLEEVVALVGRGDVTISEEGQAVQDLDRVRVLFGAALEPSLQRLARSALLVG